jgi:hypothetical protein
MMQAWGRLQVALVVFFSHGATSRSLLHRSPWTNDLKLFLIWLDAVPHAMEGTGAAAAYEAISEALYLFQRSSLAGADAQDCDKELVMLWVSDAAKTFPMLPDSTGTDLDTSSPTVRTFSVRYNLFAAL